MNTQPTGRDFSDTQAAQKKPILIVVHQKHSTPGRIGNWFTDHGYRLDIRRPRFGDALPETMENHAAAIVFGGPMSANDTDDYIKTETDWLAVPLRESAPLLGVCLGGQMLANHLGARVGKHPEERWEVGYHDVAATAAGVAVCPWPDKFFQWHGEGFALAHGATSLASGEHFENQAFSFGPAAIGIQFHPEMSFAMINRWTASNPQRLTLDGAYSRKRQIDDHVLHAPAVWQWMHDLFPRLLASELDAAPKAAPVSA